MREWICAPCGLFFSAEPPAGFSLGSDESRAPCPQCQKPASAVEGGGISCPQDAEAVEGRWTTTSRPPQVIAGLIAGAILALLFVGIELGLGALGNATEGTLSLAVFYLQRAFWLAWGGLNLFGVFKPG